ncbi:MAG: hypothetical protein WCR47_08785 [Desulfoplanes sp.]
MNKIYNAFSNITVNEQLKEITIQKIVENKKNKRTNKVNIFHLSLAMTSIVLALFVFSISSDKNNNLNEGHKVATFNTNDTSIEENDYIVYNGIKYIRDDSFSIKEDMLDEIIANTEYLQYDTAIYSIKNIDTNLKVAIKKDKEILVFVVQK